MVNEMVQNSQSLYSFTFNALFIIHEYIYSHSTTKFLFKKYIYSYLTTYFLFTKIFTHIYGCIYSHSTVYIRSHSQSKNWFNTVQYSFNIFAHPLCTSLGPSSQPALPFSSHFKPTETFNIRIILPATHQGSVKALSKAKL